MVERKPMGEHAGQVDPPRHHQVEIVADGVLAHPFHFFYPESVGADDGQFLEIDRRVLTSTRSVHTGLDQGAPANSNGRRNGPVMMTGTTRATNRWRPQHGRCSIERAGARGDPRLSLIHISEPTRLGMISYAVFCLK